MSLLDEGVAFTERPWFDFARHTWYRQSLLGQVDNCALSARFDLEGTEIENAAQARGIIFHRYAAELLRTLQRTGEAMIPSAEALEILYEVARQVDVPSEDVVIVPTRERRMLRICAIRLAQRPLPMTRLISVERRLFAKITYDHPRYQDCPVCNIGDSGCDLCHETYVVEGGGPLTREITGQPDALLADPPNGAIVLDWKTTPSAPPAPKPDRGQSHWTGDHEHVSYEGYWQQRFYAYLVMMNYPSVEQVTLREHYVLPAESRNATVPRDALEHIGREIALMVETLDRGLEEGRDSRLWRASPGKHCAYCRRPQSCPIEMQARVKQGGLTSMEEAARVAAEYVKSDEVRKVTRAALKNYHEATGHPIPVKSEKSRAELRWGKTSSGGRSFGLYVPDDSDRGPEDAALADAFAEASK